MKFVSGQSKKEFLEDLKRVTYSGSPNLASLPSLFPRFENEYPFFGIVSTDSFHLSIKDGISNPGRATDGKISETDSGIEIHVKFPFLAIPIFFLTIIISGFFIAGTVLLILTMRPEPLFCHIIAIVALLHVNKGVKREKDILITRFLSNTSANKF